MKSACIATVLSLCALFAAAAEKGDVAFSYKDWELVCDNTRTCRAAGYQDESSGSEPVSMRLTRAAGPHTGVAVDLQIGDDNGVKGTLRLKAGKAVIDGLQASGDSLDADQARTLLPELLRNGTATVSASGKKRWTLSLAGLSAVLLKMDEAQGRLDTPGALVKRGAKPESSVLPPVPAPVVNVVTPLKARPGDATLAARIFPALDVGDAKEQCNNNDEINAKSMTVSRLTDRKVLLSLGCGMGAYNYATLLWIANDKPPYAPVSIEANGDFNEKDGSVTGGMKGRGIGDCWSSQTWHFNGKDFVQTAEVGDGMCRGFAGGAWSLPSYVTRIVTVPSATPIQP
jgi:hypothetical protein